MTTFRDQVLNYPRAGLSLAETRTRRDHLANLPPELFEMAEQAAGAQASFADKLRAFVVALQGLLEEAQSAEAKPASKPAAAAKAKPTTQVPVSQSAWAEAGGQHAGDTRAKASEALRPDVEFANAAAALVLSEGIDYGTAMLKAAENDPALAKRYHEDNFGAPADLSALPVPHGFRLVTARADVEFAEKAAKIAKERDIELSEAMTLALAEDEALASRYLDFTSGSTALDELAYRVSTIQSAATAREHMTPAKAAGMVLSEDPALRTAVFAYYTPKGT
jgi:hypothetical protein